MHVRQGLRQAELSRILQVTIILTILPLGVVGVLEGQDLSVNASGNQRDGLVVVPENTIIPLELKNTITSKTAYAGENVYCETIFPVAKDDHMLIPAHSYVQGHVTEVDQPGHIIGKAQLSIRMDTIILPDGRTRPIKCSVYSLAGARLGMANEAGKGDDKNGDVGNTQAFEAPPSDESIIDASGLAGAMSLSTVSEGVGGLVLLLVSHDKRILLRPGTTLEIRLTAPLNFAPGTPDTKPQASHLQHRPSIKASHH